MTLIRMTWNILTAVAIAYAAVLVMVFLFQSRLVYYPQVGREIAVTPQSYSLKFEAVEIRTADGETLQAWWVPAENARGTVLFFHGNAGNISHRLDYLLMFNRPGIPLAGPASSPLTSRASTGRSGSPPCPALINTPGRCT